MVDKNIVFEIVNHDEILPPSTPTVSHHKKAKEQDIITSVATPHFITTG